MSNYRVYIHTQATPLSIEADRAIIDERHGHLILEEAFQEEHTGGYRPVATFARSEWAGCIKTPEAAS